MKCDATPLCSWPHRRKSHRSGPPRGVRFKVPDFARRFCLALRTQINELKTLTPSGAKRESFVFRRTSSPAGTTLPCRWLGQGPAADCVVAVVYFKYEGIDACFHCDACLKIGQTSKPSAHKPFEGRRSPRHRPLGHRRHGLTASFSSFPPGSHSFPAPRRRRCVSMVR